MISINALPAELRLAPLSLQLPSLQALPWTASSLPRACEDVGRRSTAEAVACPDVGGAVIEDTASEWIGPEPRQVSIAGREYRLSFVFVGPAAGDAGSASIDPELPILAAGPASDLPPLLTAYQEFDPAARRAFLEWIDGGRCDRNVPAAFPLHLVHCFEVALLKQGRSDLARVAHAELQRMLKLHGEDRDFRGCAETLIEACMILDPDHIVVPVPASPHGNPRDEMPFREQIYLAQMLGRSSILEADAALLYLRRQPRTDVDVDLATLFPVFYHHWSENFSYRFDGGVELLPTRTLSLTYECLDGDTFELRSNLPDPASAPVPAALRQFFDECHAELSAFRDLHVAQQKSIIDGLKSRPKLRGQEPSWSLRPDYEELVLARVAGKDIRMMAASELLADLFDDEIPPSNKQLPAKACRRMWRALDDIGVGFEPDDRYGLPARLRPDTQVAVFREEPMPFHEPPDAFHLAQAVMVLAALATMHPFYVEPIAASDIELRLPYRHRYSDRELRRLEACFLVMRRAVKPRELLASWPRRMKRLERLKHIDLGFGIAFHAQAQNPMVKRFATAVSKALHHNEMRVPHFLAELEAQVQIDSELARLRASGAIASTTPATTVREFGPQLKASGPDPARESKFGGLPPLLAEILEALVRGPQPRSVLNAIARRGHLQIAGVLEALNEWSLQELGGHLTRGHQTVRINPELFDAVELIVRQK